MTWCCIQSHLRHIGQSQAFCCRRMARPRTDDCDPDDDDDGCSCLCLTRRTETRSLGATFCDGISDVHDVMMMMLMMMMIVSMVTIMMTTLHLSAPSAAPGDGPEPHLADDLPPRAGRRLQAPQVSQSGESALTPLSTIRSDSPQAHKAFLTQVRRIGLDTATNYQIRFSSRSLAPSYREKLP
jgi:hypothetical protein